MKQPTKAIICAAGLGSRFLPQTKANPKEMLPIIDRPVIQLIVEEAVAAGVTDIIIVTDANKRSIEDHFDRNEALEDALRERGKDDKADGIRAIANLANFIYIRQKGTPKGNARPVLNAQHLLGDDEPFFVFCADDFFRARTPRAVQLKEVYEKTGKSVISLIEVDLADADKYGMVAIDSQLDETTFRLSQLVEKPGGALSPSTYASVGGYLLTAEIMPILAKATISKRGELELAEAINELIQSGEVYGRFIDGTWHDTGDPLKYMQAVVDMALSSDQYGDAFAAYLKKRLQ
ncbi:MAG: UTP--glucose-1-phosphate uridylyltransferase [Candidatus Saccharimonadales bacterium]